MFGGRSPLCLSLQRRLLAYCPSGCHLFLLGVLLLLLDLLLLLQWVLVRLRLLLHHHLHCLHEWLVVLAVAEGLMVVVGPGGPVRFHLLVRLLLLPWSFVGVLVIVAV